LGNPLIVQTLKALVAKEKPDLLFFMETKNCDEVLIRLKRTLHFLHLQVFSPVGLAGGLALFWNDGLWLTDITSTPHLFDFICQDISEDRTMRITVLHASLFFKRVSIFGRLCGNLAIIMSYLGYA